MEVPDFEEMAKKNMASFNKSKKIVKMALKQEDKAQEQNLQIAKAQRRINKNVKNMLPKENLPVNISSSPPSVPNDQNARD